VDTRNHDRASLDRTSVRARQQEACQRGTECKSLTSNAARTRVSRGAGSARARAFVAKREATVLIRCW
jgi:hypothetical protein